MTAQISTSSRPANYQLRQACARGALLAMLASTVVVPFVPAIASTGSTLALSPAKQTNGDPGETHPCNSSDPDERIRGCTQALETETNVEQRAIALNNRGSAYADKGATDKAIADFTAAIRIHPTYATAWVNRGTNLSELQQYQRAIADLDQAIKLRPNWIAPYFARGATYRWYAAQSQPVDRSKMLLAIQDLSVVVNADRDHVEARSYRGYAYAILDDHARAVSDFNVALRHDPAHLTTLMGRGLSLAKLGDFKAGIADLKRALAQTPKSDSDRQNQATGRRWLAEVEAKARQAAVATDPAVFTSGGKTWVLKDVGPSKE